MKRHATLMRSLKNRWHYLMANLATFRYGHPSRHIFVIGVTGTDGKTTTTSMIYHILKQAGKKVAMITSVGAYIGDELYDIGFHVTTPSAFAVQRYLRQAVNAGNEYVVLETTSHALDQYRVHGVDYQIGVLTNITHEHLDYHGTFRSYVAAKLRLLMMAPVCVINRDDASYQLIRPALDGKQVLTYAIHHDATLTPKKFPFTTKLFGEFNRLNSLAAALVAKQLRISDRVIKAALLSFTPPPGRQEIVYDKEFMVIIDFAHTPNSFQKILPALAEKASGRLIHVFGSAGLRDATKRPLMGEQSAAHADIIILTTEDPRTESAAEIADQIAGGIPSTFVRMDPESYSVERPPKTPVLLRIPDRAQAIGFAIRIARKGDIVALTGKSHEKSMNYGQGEVAWDEFAAARKALADRQDGKA